MAKGVWKKALRVHRRALPRLDAQRVYSVGEPSRVSMQEKKRAEVFPPRASRNSSGSGDPAPTDAFDVGRGPVPRQR